MLVNEIAKIITKVAKAEDSLLLRVANEGIFHMPELAFAYECGKQIMVNSEQVFGSNTAVWAREKNLGNGGPTDLVFELSNEYRVAIEFKLRDTSESYIKDTIKLSKLNESTLKFFCALIDVFDTALPDDGRQKIIEQKSEYQVNEIQKTHFQTKQNWYSSPVSCVVCIWSVGYVPDV